MSDYWKKHFDASVQKFPDSPLKQVGKTVGGQEVDRSQIDLWAAAITEQLGITADDRVVDLCCGNGLITKIIAQSCNKISGVDFSESLIYYARSVNGGPNIEYRIANVVELDDAFFSGVSKVYMYEALQHLSAGDFGILLAQIAKCISVEKVFLGGVADHDRMGAFYDTDEKIAFHLQREAIGEPHIGKWWSQAEVIAVAECAGFGARIIPQNNTLYASHFRFDCLIERR